jgi:CRISPR-associated protein Cas4
MREEIRQYVLQVLGDIASADTQLVLLLILLVTSLIVIDAISSFARKKSKEVGISHKSGTVSIDGSKALPVKKYFSEMQGLAGTPDAVISENGHIIPVERKPLARKIRDRYVAQLLVYMRLVEEFEGKKPPYGYLILGPNCRRFKIENTPERQAWLQKMIDEMREILDGTPSKPSPHPTKCRKCSVRESCVHKIQDQPAAVVKINGKAVGANKIAG